MSGRDVRQEKGHVYVRRTNSTTRRLRSLCTANFAVLLQCIRGGDLSDGV